MSKLEFKAEIKLVERVGPDILRFETERPSELSFAPGHAVMIGVPDSGEEPGCFSPTSRPSSSTLEFFVKVYRKHGGLTERLEKCREGDIIEISDGFGKIEYRDTGIFLAAGTGITPFLSILRQLEADNLVEGNELYYAESKRAELIQERELRDILSHDVHFVLSEEESEQERLDADFLEENVVVSDELYYYLCGPLEFEHDMLDWLESKEIDKYKIIREDR